MKILMCHSLIEAKASGQRYKQQHDVEANMHPEEHYRSGSSYESEQSKNQDDGIQLKEEKPCRSAEAQRIHFGRVRMPV